MYTHILTHTKTHAHTRQKMSNFHGKSQQNSFVGTNPHTFIWRITYCTDQLLKNGVELPPKVATEFKELRDAANLYNGPVDETLWFNIKMPWQ